MSVHRRSPQLLRPSLLAAAGFYLLLFCCAFVFLLLVMQRDINLYDEGVMLVGATRVGNGEIPHHDFYANYGPAQFYILSGLFKLFSPSIFIERLWDTLVRALTVTCIFLIVERAATRREAIFASIISIIWLGLFCAYAYPVFPALLFTLISAFFLLHLLQGKAKRFHLLLAGASVGFVALFRYDIGLGVLATEVLVISGYVLNQKPSGKENLADLVSILVPYGLGVSIIFLPIALAYLTFAPLNDFIFDIIQFPSRYYAKTRALPFPTLHDLVNVPYQLAVYLPIYVWFITFFVLLRSQPSNMGDPLVTQQARVERWILILFCALSMVLYVKGFVRVSPLHMGISIIASFVLFAIILKHRLSGDRVVATIIWISIAAFVVYTLTLNDTKKMLWQLESNIKFIISPSTWKEPTSEKEMAAGSCRAPIGFERTACFRMENKQIKTIRFLQERTDENELIFIGLSRHDKFILNDALLYFALKLQPATKWHQFDPGLQTSVDIQREMVAELESVKPRFVVLESLPDANEPNASAVSSGVTILDLYIKNNYDEVTTFDNIRILERINRAKQADRPPVA